MAAGFLGLNGALGSEIHKHDTMHEFRPVVEAVDFMIVLWDDSVHAQRCVDIADEGFHVLL